MLDYHKAHAPNNNNTFFHIWTLDFKYYYYYLV